MKNLERRLSKLEDYAARMLSQPSPVDRDALRKLSRYPDAVELAREYTELMIAGLPTDSLEQKLNDLWSKHVSP